MTKYIRYIIALALFASLFYTHSITISNDTINNTIQSKLPIEKDKKGAIVKITEIKLNNLEGKTINSTIVGSIRMSEKNILKTSEKASSLLGKFSSFINKPDLEETLKNKSLDFNMDTTMKINIKGSTLYFKLISIENPVKIIKKFEPIIKKVVNQSKMKIKQLEKYSWAISISNFGFDESEDLIVDIAISKLILFALIFLFLLREVGLLLIIMYQKFLSPKKGYSCAKNHVHKNGSCSSTTKQAFKDGGFISGMKEYRNSTKECKKAYKSIQNDKNNSKCDTAMCAGCDGAPLAFGGETTAFSGIEASSCAGLGECGAGGCDGIGSC